MTNADDQPTLPLRSAFSSPQRPAPSIGQPERAPGEGPADPSGPAAALVPSTGAPRRVDDDSAAHTPPVAGESYGLFIGVSEYTSPDYGARPQVEVSAQALAQVFATRSVWHMPPDQQTVLTGYLTQDRILAELEQAARRRTGLLVVYLGGHGRRFRDEQGLYLAMSDSRFHRFATHLPFRQIRSILKESTIQRKLLITDSCFAVDAHLGAEEFEDLAESGAWSITAVDRLQEAIATWRDTRYTALVGALLEAIGTGVGHKPKVLDIRELYREAEDLLDKEQKPHPELLAGAGYLPLFPNPHPLAVSGETTVGRGTGVGMPRFTRGEESAEEIAEILMEHYTHDRSDLFRQTMNTVVQGLPTATSARVLHLTHLNGIRLDTRTFAPLPKTLCADLVTQLSNHACEVCRAIATGLVIGASIATWSTADLVRLAAGLPDTPRTISGPVGGSGPEAAFLAELTPGQLLAVAAGVWSSPGPGYRARRLRAAALTEQAAQRAGCAELLDLAGRGISDAAGEDGARELTAVLLESIAATASGEVLAELVRKTNGDTSPGSTGVILRTAIVLRRPPAFLAALVRSVDDAEAGTARPLLEAALRHANVRDLTRVLLVLRDSGPPLPVVGEVFGELPGRFGVPELAEAAVLLDAFGDEDSLRTVLKRLAGAASPDEDVVRLIRELREPGPGRPAASHLVSEVLRRATERDPASLLRLFTLLRGAGLVDEAGEVLGSVRRGQDSTAVTKAVRAYSATHQPNRAELDVLVGELVGMCSVDEVFELYFEVRNQHPDAHNTIDTELARRWPVERIVALTGKLEEVGWAQVARDLLQQAVDQLRTGEPGPGIGTRTGEMLVALADSPVWDLTARQTREMIQQLAELRQPAEVMNLIATLHAAHCYSKFRSTVENQIVKAFGWEQLAALPGERKMKFLPAVLEIELIALTEPLVVPPTKVAAVVRALRDAGAGAELDELIGHLGHIRVDHLDVVNGLNAAGLGADADRFDSRTPRQRPAFLTR